MGTLDGELTREFRPLRGSCYYVAVAFLTQPGFQRLVALPRFSGATSRLVIGLGNYITSPSAIRSAITAGIAVRLVPDSRTGIFHPKLYVLADSTGPEALYIGSANCTAAAFAGNTELGFVTTSRDDCAAGIGIFNEWFNALKRPTDGEIADYARKYTRINNKRVRSQDNVAMLADLSLSRPDDAVISARIGRARPAPTRGLLDARDARTAWVSLESFTGEYTFQVEIPARAAEVLSTLGLPRRGDIEFRCEDDVVRTMTYGFYGDNGMFRLNIPNDVPNVEVVRRSHSGILLITRAHQGLLLRIVPDPEQIRRYVERSVAYGSWGRTPTRTYGWF